MDNIAEKRVAAMRLCRMPHSVTETVTEKSRCYRLCLSAISGNPCAMAQIWTAKAFESNVHLMRW